MGNKRRRGRVTANVEERAQYTPGVSISNPDILNLLGLSSKSKIPVSPNLAFNCSTIHACVRVRFERMLSCPVMVYRMMPDGRRQKAFGTPEYRLLHDSPNREMTAVMLRAKQQRDIDTWGNHYSFVERAVGSGRPIAIWPLAPFRVHPVRDDAGVLQYEYRPQSGAVKLYPAEDIIHLANTNTKDGLVGDSPIMDLAPTIRQDMGADQLMVDTLEKGAVVAGFLQHPGSLTAKGRDNWNKALKERALGGSERGSWMLLEENMSFQAANMAFDTLELLGSRKLSKEAICGAYQVNPNMIGSSDASTFNNTENYWSQFVTVALLPSARVFESEVSRKLWPNGEFFCEIMFDGLLRGNTTERMANYEKLLTNGLRTIEEISELENFDVPKGPDGKVAEWAQWHFVRSNNLFPLEKWDSKPTKATPAPPEPPASEDVPARSLPWERLLRAAFQLIESREDSNLLSLQGKQPEARAAWVDSHAKYVRDRLEPVVLAYFDMNPVGEQLRDGYLDGLIKRQEQRLSAKLTGGSVPPIDDLVVAELGRLATLGKGDNV